MRSKWCWVVVVVAMAGCRLGSGDEAVATIVVASQQPMNGSDGLLADVLTSCGGDDTCQLSVGVLEGTLQRPGDAAPMAAFCQTQESQVAQPVLFIPATGRSEVIAEVQLFKATKDGSCSGHVLAATQTIVRAASVARDAGGSNAQ